MYKSKPKIAYLVTEYPSRSHTFIRRERDALIDKGIDIDMLSIRRCPKSELIDSQDHNEWDTTWSILPVGIVKMSWLVLIRFISSPIKFISTAVFSSHHRLSGFKNWIWSIFYFIEAIVVSDHLEKIHAKHLHVHFAISSARVGILCNKLINIPWSITLHGACDFEYPDGPLLGEKLDSVDFAVCVSHYGLSQAMRTISPKSWDKLMLVRCGIRRNQMIDPTKLVTLKDAPVIYGIGRLSSEKGQIGLIKAFVKILESAPDAKLKLIGDGPDKDYLVSYAEELCINEHISWLGARTESNVIELLRSDAQVLVVPSFMEGLPVVLIEAMSNGVCVVAPRIAGVPELIDDNLNGLLYHPANWQDLAEKVCMVIQNKSLRAKLNQNAWKKVNDEFCVERNTELLAELFNKANVSLKDEMK